MVRDIHRLKGIVNERQLVMVGHLRFLLGDGVTGTGLNIDIHISQFVSMTA
jgi:hypothetical protein